MCPALSAPWGMQSDVGLASDMEGEMNVCNRRQAGLRKGLQSLPHGVHLGSA